MMRVRQYTMPAVILALAVTAAAPAPATAQAGRTVTLARALEIARARQPDVRIARASAASARASVQRARSSRLPTLDASASYNLSGASPDPANPADVARVGLSAGLLLWDFGQSARAIGASQDSAEAAAQQARQTELDVAFAVRTTYFAARAARELVGVARETLANEERHVLQIEAFVEIGRRPEIDRYQARTQLANARVALLQAENGYELAKAELARAIGDPGAAGLEIGDETMPAVAGEEAGDDVLFAEAAKTRPDLLALGHARSAAEQDVSGARAAYLPEIRAGVGLDGVALVDSGTDGDDDLTWGWSAGLTVSWRLFDGFARGADVRAAEAGVIIADARRDALAQDVRVELRKARLAVRAAKAVRGAADEAIANARKQLELAEGRYAEGVGNAIELGDAQVGVTFAAAQVVQAEYDLASARAQLLHALGR